MNLTLTYTLTPADLEAFFRGTPKALAEYPRLKPGEKRPFLISATTMLGWIIILSLAVLVFIIFHKSPDLAAEPPSSSGSTIGTFVPYILVFIVAWIFLRRRNSARTQAKTAWEKNPDLQQPQTLIITPELILVRSPTVEARFVWEHFTHVYEDDAVVLLYDTSKGARILPKRAFTSPEEADAFVDYCRSRISAAPNAFPVITNSPPPVG